MSGVTSARSDEDNRLAIVVNVSPTATTAAAAAVVETVFRTSATSAKGFNLELAAAFGHRV